MFLREYLDDMVREIETLGDIYSRQARALFTSVCITQNIQADTSICDSLLSELYALSVTAETKNKNFGYDAFESFMLSDII